MIQNFDKDRINFVRFIQENKDIFYELLESGRYNLTSNSPEVRKNFNEKYIYDGYYFFKNFNLGDDADVYGLTDDLDDFNQKGKTKIQTIINEFERWLQRDIVKEKFEKEYNKKIKREEEKIKTLFRDPLNKIEEIGTKRRTMKRTSQIKNELSDIDYVPEDRQNSVMGKTYRSVRDEFNKRNKIGGIKRKTKKYRKNRRSKRNM
jgi:hypothetical protein